MAFSIPNIPPTGITTGGQPHGTVTCSQCYATVRDEHWYNHTQFHYKLVSDINNAAFGDQPDINHLRTVIDQQKTAIDALQSAVGRLTKTSAQPVRKRRGTPPATITGTIRPGTEINSELTYTKSPKSGDILPHVIDCPHCGDPVTIRGDNIENHWCPQIKNFVAFCQECGQSVNGLDKYQHVYRAGIWIGHRSCVTPNEKAPS